MKQKVKKNKSEEKKIYFDHFDKALFQLINVVKIFIFKTALYNETNAKLLTYFL